MSSLLHLGSIPVDILQAARKVSAWTEANGGKYWELDGLCDRRFAYLNPLSCGDCDPCLGGRPDQCAVNPRVLP